MGHFMAKLVSNRWAKVARCVLVIAAIAAASQAGVSEARGYRGYRGYRGGRSYGSNFGYTYSTPRFRYYNGPAFWGYGGYGGGNVQYFQRGRNAFWVGTGYGANGRIQTNTGFFFFR